MQVAYCEEQFDNEEEGCVRACAIAYICAYVHRTVGVCAVSCCSRLTRAGHFFNVLYFVSALVTIYLYGSSIRVQNQILLEKSS